ncbi:MAG: peptidylprolyl isomerase [Phycisphaerales bacterium]|nr:peptidylprolyl isomerase [Phycisphaerales bacterium]
MRLPVVAALLAGGLALAPVRGDGFAGIEALVSAPVANIHPGNPVPVRFTLHNSTDKPVVLSVPDAEPKPPTAVAQLPLAHVFSGAGFGGVTIRGDYDRVWADATGYHAPAEAEELILGPHALVGTEIDLASYFPALQSPGRYRIVWQPYGGLLTSNQLIVEIAPLKQAEIITDDGVMVVQFFYELAPNHVANFLELARNGFYNQKTFHRLEKGYFIQGGDPNGDGSGIRTDGKKLTAEFSAYPIDRGTVCMARLENDPDSASCQFLIANTRIPSWDGRYTVFGHLVGEESERTLDKLMAHDVDPDTGRPERTMYIRAVSLSDAPPPNEVAPLQQLSAQQAPLPPAQAQPLPVQPAPMQQMTRQPLPPRPTPTPQNESQRIEVRQMTDVTPD